jgi:DNA-binding transcriptional ArsR family regulator
VIATPCPVQGDEFVAETTCCRYKDFVKALADETRQAILELLQDGQMRPERCTQRLVRPFVGDEGEL